MPVRANNTVLAVRGEWTERHSVEEIRSWRLSGRRRRYLDRDFGLRGALRAFVRESNRGGPAWFMADAGELEKRVAPGSLFGEGEVGLAEAGELAVGGEEAGEVGVGGEAAGEPGVAEDVGAGFAGGDHVGHLGLLLGEGGDLGAVILAVPVGELGDPNEFAVFGEAVELGGEAVVVPVKGEVVDLGSAIVVGGLIGGVKGVEPGDGVLIVGHGAPGDGGADDLDPGLGGDAFVGGPDGGGLLGGEVGLAGEVGLVEDEEVLNVGIGFEIGDDLAGGEVAVPEHGVIVRGVLGGVVGRDRGVWLGSPVVPPAYAGGESGEVGGGGEVVGDAALGAFGGGGVGRRVRSGADRGHGNGAGGAAAGEGEG